MSTNAISDVVKLTGVAVNTDTTGVYRKYSSQAFDFKELCKIFGDFCKDFNSEIVRDKPSQALEFSSKVLLEFGPMMRNLKGKGDKAVRFSFPAKQTDGSLSIRVVIVSTFKMRPELIVDEKMVITMKQATLLAMVTFCKVAEYSIATDGDIVMTPLCHAIYSKDSVSELSAAIGKTIGDTVKIINCSTTPNGHYLPESDMACAIVAVISATKGISNKGTRDQMMNKVIKQYAAQHKEYSSSNFTAFAEHALGGVPQGLDAGTLIDNFRDVQTSARLRREPRDIPRVGSSGGSGSDNRRPPGGGGGRGGQGGSGGMGGQGVQRPQQTTAPAYRELKPTIAPQSQAKGGLPALGLEATKQRLAEEI